MIAEYGLPCNVWYSIRMLQGSFSRSCGLYAFSFLAMRSPGLPLGAITDVFREYDFAYNEAKIRRLLWCHMHTCWPLPLPLPPCSLLCSYLLSLLEAWKHASPLTVLNITDAGGPKKHSPQGQPTPYQCLPSDRFARYKSFFTTSNYGSRSWHEACS